MMSVMTDNAKNIDKIRDALKEDDPSGGVWMFCTLVELTKPAYHTSCYHET